MERAEFDAKQQALQALLTNEPGQHFLGQAVQGPVHFAGAEDDVFLRAHDVPLPLQSVLPCCKTYGTGPGGLQLRPLCPPGELTFIPLQLTMTDSGLQAEPRVCLSGGLGFIMTGGIKASGGGASPAGFLFPRLITFGRPRHRPGRGTPS